MLKELKKKIDSGTSKQDISLWLNQKPVRYSAAYVSSPAEQIPPEILADLTRAKDGQSLFIEKPTSALIVTLVSSVAQPISEADAAPKISKFLSNQAMRKGIAAEITRLKQKSSITYLGEFASSTPEPKTAPLPSAKEESVPSGMEKLYKEVGH